MNDAFQQIPEEKQLAIFNASMEVFAKNDYKKALYLETYDYVMRVGRTAIDDPHLFEITDF